MGKVAFVFSGQGDQHPGMGDELCRNYSAAKNAFDLCDAIRPGTSQQCFFGTEDELRETKNTQPCMFAMEMAAAAVLTDRGLFADMVAGFSLGELSALTYADAWTLKSGFSLVCKRGELMQRDAEKQETAMTAVLKLTNEQVETLCARFNGFYPVNYNCPGQISVSGPASDMREFCASVKESGGKVLPLKVKGAFHSPYMSDAATDFALELEKIDLRPLKIPVYSDFTGELYQTNVGLLISQQIHSPVRWEQIVRNMLASGADRFVEIGPGKTLCNLISRIDSSAHVFPISHYQDIDELIREVKAC